MADDKKRKGSESQDDVDQEGQLGGQSSYSDQDSDQDKRKDEDTREEQTMKLHSPVFSL